jgi:hypothetical protein
MQEINVTKVHMQLVLITPFRFLVLVVFIILLGIILLNPV